MSEKQTDIVERLRQCDENFDLVQEAADEIERLRSALSEIARLAANDSPWFAEIAEIARAALKEQP
jgi:hypothetical protein